MWDIPTGRNTNPKHASQLDRFFYPVDSASSTQTFAHYWPSSVTILWFNRTCSHKTTGPAILLALPWSLICSGVAVKEWSPTLDFARFSWRSAAKQSSDLDLHCSCKLLCLNKAVNWGNDLKTLCYGLSLLLLCWPEPPLNGTSW